jgi:chemotaxis regulatin CheY-phosphate phosphatase CheZ
MRDNDLNMLLQKAEELKALFVLGQRVIPFLEEIFHFIKDTTPLLDDINVSIRENLQKMPKASKQLSKVTEATESATNEIMDTVDGVLYKTRIIATNLKHIEDLQPPADNPISSEYGRLAKNSNELLKSIENDAQNIMMALQVQDITSQQIAAVNSVLETVQSKLGSILKNFKESEFASLVDTAQRQTVTHDHTKTEVSKLHRTIAFDPDAVEAISSNLDRQSEVDELLRNVESGQIDLSAAKQSANLETASADDIDALFASTHAPSAGITSDETASADDIDALFASSNTPKLGVAADEPASADDIDALFGHAAPMAGIAADEPVSADDIDALFGNTQSSQADTKQNQDAHIRSVLGDTDSDEPASADDIDALFNPR